MRDYSAEDRTRPFPQADRHARVVMDELAAAIWYLESLNEQYEIAERVAVIEQQSPPGIVRQSLSHAFMTQVDEITALSRQTRATIERLERTLTSAYWDVSPAVKMEIEVFIEMTPEPTDPRAQQAMEEILRERANKAATDDQSSD